MHQHQVGSTPRAASQPVHSASPACAAALPAGASALPSLLQLPSRSWLLSELVSTLLVRWLLLLLPLVVPPPPLLLVEELHPPLPLLLALVVPKPSPAVAVGSACCLLPSLTRPAAGHQAGRCCWIHINMCVDRLHCCSRVVHTGLSRPDKTRWHAVRQAIPSLHPACTHPTGSDTHGAACTPAAHSALTCGCSGRHERSSEPHTRGKQMRATTATWHQHSSSNKLQNQPQQLTAWPCHSQSVSQTDFCEEVCSYGCAAAGVYSCKWQSLTSLMRASRRQSPQLLPAFTSTPSVDVNAS
jgi:hypothetical protein